MSYELRRRRGYEFYELRRRRGCAMKDSESVQRTRLCAIDLLERKHGREVMKESPSAAKKCPRMTEVHTASLAEKEVAKQHARKWSPALDETRGASPGPPLDAVNAAAATSPADLSEELLGRELTSSRIRKYAALVRCARTRGPAVWGKFDVVIPWIGMFPPSLRWILVGPPNGKMIDGETTVGALLEAGGFKDADLRKGLLETAGSVDLLPSYLRLLSLSALRKWEIRRLEIKNACPQADVFNSEVYAHVARKWELSRPESSRRLREPAYWLNDAPVAPYGTLHAYMLDARSTEKHVG